ncbi:alpha/beta fold hydrolase [Streptomyces armeniacus]|nr:alpha/beta hydrolase [Streptomyces armeniacus]
MYASLRSLAFTPAGFEEHRLVCGTGNILTCYKRVGLPDGPTLVLDAGLMSTSVSWLLVVDRLDPAITVVVYDRAGYRKSQRRAYEPYCLAESVDDLREVVTHARAGAGPVFLAGHSLGGYFSYQVAGTSSRSGGSEAPAPAVDGIILVDPMHPRELMKSPRQREGSRSTHMTMKLGSVTAYLGGSLLSEEADLVFKLCVGNPYEKQLRREMAAGRTWRAGKREWEQSYALMLDGGRSLNRVPVPVSVIAAGETLRPEVGQRPLLDEYVTLGTGGGVTEIEGASHQSMLWSGEYAPRTAEALERIMNDSVKQPGGTGPDRAGTAKSETR